MKKKFILDGLDCANCAAKMEQAINELDGVRKATVNFMTTKMVIDGEEEKMPTIIAEAERIVKKFEPDTRMKKA
ncbi:heavy-metal-associated domain-containing protein [Facklamia hominis]|uniref:heavy-metal-associated domain-containing protein n=1 Tax=Facklamia hominis TaxID=178214 RepID=UPI00288A1B32|nr:heavy-metal-associated domain-containing protein [Facklamia hominis]